METEGLRYDIILYSADIWVNLQEHECKFRQWCDRVWVEAVTWDSSKTAFKGQVEWGAAEPKRDLERRALRRVF